MRILHSLHAHACEGGHPLPHIYDLAMKQAQNGHQVGIVYAQSGHLAITKTLLEKLQKFCALGVFQLTIDTSSPLTEAQTIFPAISRARAFVQKTAPDLLHAHGGKNPREVLNAWLISRQGNKARFVYSPHGTLASNRRQSWPASNAEKQLWRKADGIIFESADSEKRILDRFGPPRGTTRVIYDGLAQEDFAPRQIIDMASDFLTLGELALEQGIDTLIKALARMKNSHKTGALIVGSGAQEKQLRAQVDRYGLSHAVFFNAPLHPKDAFLKGGCLVLPSRSSIAPRLVLQAAAAGMPMILTDIGAVRELIGEIEMPLIQPNDTGALQDQLVSYLTDTQPFLARATALRQSVAKNFTRARMADEVEQFYQTLLKNGAS